MHEKAPSRVAVRQANTPGQVLFASLIGTTIEFFDFYIYATAAVLVVPRLVFPTSEPSAAVLASIETVVLFYLMTVFSLSWGTSVLGYSRNTFLLIQLLGVVFFALTIPISALIAERGGRRATLIWVTVAIGVFGLVMAPLLTSGLVGATIAMVVGLSLMGLTYGPLGTTLSELFPTRVRYTGSSLTFNLAGIFGASLAPYIATWLAQNYGLQFVGYYVVVAALLTLVGLVAIEETKDQRL